jgi:hypothetical protein
LSSAHHPNGTKRILTGTFEATFEKMSRSSKDICSSALLKSSALSMESGIKINDNNKNRNLQNIDF